MSSFSQLITNVKKARAAFNRGRSRSDAKRNNHTFRHSVFPSSLSSTSVVEPINLLPTSSPWDLLPVELQIKIFAHCGVADFLPLKLVCRSFFQLLTSQEHWITRQYLRQRRHGTLPSPIDSERTYSRHPEDDVVLLSDLFPPISSAKGGHLYTFRYIHSLRRRQKLCSKLCYYLADRVVDRFMRCEPGFVKSRFPSRNERSDFMKRAIGTIWFYLTPLMYYTLYFLETYTLARREQTNTLLRDFEAGRLPVRLPPDARKSIYRDLQVQILQSPPFTDTATLVSTHHCMQLLVSYLQYTVPPDEPGPADDSWISSLLTVSPFMRVLEYFSAEIGDGGSQRMQRKEFMHNFHNDITSNEKDDMNSRVFECAPHIHVHGSTQDVWFDVATQELTSRRAMQHKPELVLVWDGLPIVFGCQYCRDSAGWRA
ncbi:hypothetical protein P170DRAFT_454385 [Aspergillus steynii IBT 23096]|uniref:F-box domain-containing protein n=1 Tax=Aspergillus steynii IBT 23096 TaxID=1392250 RepID=A0A2I2GK48_9EURO|nr:uncharacterized protein P170DRAFT_454385 [Aspergillus steynii IBT 23096]PLB53250.1 hypothetical protein P170DRAFT_454385 [Aspergillus steynii IBT 23096]